MNILPKNRHLLVEVVESPSKKESAILVPDDYSAKSTKEYELAKVLATFDDCNLCEVGQHILIEGHMVKHINVLNENFQLVLENYVVAVVGDVEV
tara:strand:+ start:26 stop:310 length:285 start_codon:yes stop_codon:yes gene_type:complete